MKGERRWSDFAAAAPDLARAGERLFYQTGDVGSAFLATVAPDHGPRVHPVFPVVALGDLWLFIVDLSPKYRDLRRNGWYALHTLPTQSGGEEFYLRGHAEAIEDPAAKKHVVEATDGRQGANDFERLFRCTLKSVLHTHWDHWGTAQAWPQYSKWEA